MKLLTLFAMTLISVTPGLLAMEEGNVSDHDIREFSRIVDAGSLGKFVHIIGVNAYCPCGDESDCLGSAQIAIDNNELTKPYELVKTSKGWAISENQKWLNELDKLGEKINSDLTRPQLLALKEEYERVNMMQPRCKSK